MPALVRTGCEPHARVIPTAARGGPSQSALTPQSHLQSPPCRPACLTGGCALTETASGPRSTLAADPILTAT